MKPTLALLDRMRALNEWTKKILAGACMGICGITVIVVWIYFFSANLQVITDSGDQTRINLPPPLPQGYGAENSALSPGAGIVESFRGIQSLIMRRKDNQGQRMRIGASVAAFASEAAQKTGTLLMQFTNTIFSSAENSMDALANRFSRQSQK